MRSGERDCRRSVGGLLHRREALSGGAEQQQPWRRRAWRSSARRSSASAGAQVQECRSSNSGGRVWQFGAVSAYVRRRVAEHHQRGFLQGGDRRDAAFACALSSSHAMAGHGHHLFTVRRLQFRHGPGQGQFGHLSVRGDRELASSYQLSLEGLLLETFKQGWLLNVHRILLVSNSSDPQLQPYLVYAIKSSTEDLAPVKCFFGSSPNPCAETQMQILEDTIKKENELRSQGGFIDNSDIYEQLYRVRRTRLKLGGHYPAVVLDAKPDAKPPALRCGVFLVPKSRPHEWLFSSEEGQWQVIETAQAGRLILVTLDAQ